MFATVEAVTSKVPSCPDSRWAWSVLWLTTSPYLRWPGATDYRMLGDTGATRMGR